MGRIKQMQFRGILAGIAIRVDNGQEHFAVGAVKRRGRAGESGDGRPLVPCRQRADPGEAVLAGGGEQLAIRGGGLIGLSAAIVTNTAGTGNPSTLAINGSGSHAGTIADGSSGGTGAIAAAITINSGGVLIPGTLTTSTGITFTSGSRFGVEISSAAGPASPGSTAGTLPNTTTNNFLNNLGGTSSGLNLLSLVVDCNSAAFAVGASYSYVIAGGMGDQSQLNVTDPDAFNIFDLPANDYAVNASLTGDVNGNVYLNFTVLPEPGLLLAFGAIAFGVTPSIQREEMMPIVPNNQTRSMTLPGISAFVIYWRHHYKGAAMPAVLTNKHCPSCKGKHTLCYEPDVMLDAKREYSFTCPATQGVVTFVAGFVEPHVIPCPDDAVKLYDA